MKHKAPHGVKTDEYAVTYTIGIVSLLRNVTIGFIAGMALVYFLRWIRTNHKKTLDLLIKHYIVPPVRKLGLRHFKVRS